MPRAVVSLPRLHRGRDDRFPSISELKPFNRHLFADGSIERPHFPERTSGRIAVFLAFQAVSGAVNYHNPAKNFSWVSIARFTFRPVQHRSGTPLKRNWPELASKLLSE